MTGSDSVESPCGRLSPRPGERARNERRPEARSLSGDPKASGLNPLSSEPKASSLAGDGFRLVGALSRARTPTARVRSEQGCLVSRGFTDSGSI